MAFKFDELLFSPMEELVSRREKGEYFDDVLLKEFTEVEQREKLLPLEAQRFDWIMSQLLSLDRGIKLSDFFLLPTFIDEAPRAPNMKSSENTLYLFLLSVGYKDNVIVYLNNQKSSAVCEMLCKSCSQLNAEYSNFDRLLSAPVDLDALVKLLLPIAKEPLSNRHKLITMHSLQTSLSSCLTDVTLYLIMLLIKQEDVPANKILSEFFNEPSNREKLDLEKLRSMIDDKLIRGYLLKLDKSKLSSERGLKPKMEADNTSGSLDNEIDNVPSNSNQTPRPGSKPGSPK